MVMPAMDAVSAATRVVRPPRAPAMPRTTPTTSASRVVAITRERVTPSRVLSVPATDSLLLIDRPRSPWTASFSQAQ
jgi:hypothetical protein